MHKYRVERPSSFVPMQGVSIMNCLLMLCFITHDHIAQLLKQDVDNWNNTTPACCHVDVLAVDRPDTAPFLSYYAPLCGIIPKDISLLINRRLQSTG